MANRSNTTVTYIIDGNNYICEEKGISQPTCDQDNDFLARIDNWLEYEAEEEHREFSVYVVFDPGAEKHYLSSRDTDFEVADNERADSVILRLARKLRKEHHRRIIIISNERKNEFAVLKREGFRLEKNIYFAKILDEPDKLHMYFDESFNWESKPFHEAGDEKRKRDW